jgi:hypothetical protein
MENTVLTNDNFVLYAMHNYDNPECHGVTEFEDDLNRFKYLKRLFYRYKERGELKERLVINHLIVLYNVFGSATTKMLFFKIEKEFWPQLKTFLVFLNYMPMEVIADKRIQESDIPLDENIIKVLRKV